MCKEKQDQPFYIVDPLPSQNIYSVEGTYLSPVNLEIVRCASNPLTSGKRKRSWAFIFTSICHFL